MIEVATNDRDGREWTVYSKVLNQGRFWGLENIAFQDTCQELAEPDQFPLFCPRNEYGLS